MLLQGAGQQTENCINHYDQALQICQIIRLIFTPWCIHGTPLELGSVVPSYGTIVAIRQDTVFESFYKPEKDPTYVSLICG